MQIQLVGAVQFNFEAQQMSRVERFEWHARAHCPRGRNFDVVFRKLNNQHPLEHDRWRCRWHFKWIIYFIDVSTAKYRPKSDFWHNAQPIVRPRERPGEKMIAPGCQEPRQYWCWRSQFVQRALWILNDTMSANLCSALPLSAAHTSEPAKLWIFICTGKLQFFTVMTIIYLKVCEYGMMIGQRTQQYLWLKQSWRYKSGLLFSSSWRPFGCLLLIHIKIKIKSHRS